MGQMIPCPFQLNEPVRVECIIEELVHRRARKSELLLEGFVVFVTPRYFVFSYTEAMLDVYDLKDHIETRIELINECVEMIENLHHGRGYRVLVVVGPLKNKRHMLMRQSFKLTEVIFRGAQLICESGVCCIDVDREVPDHSALTCSPLSITDTCLPSALSCAATVSAMCCGFAASGRTIRMSPGGSSFATACQSSKPRSLGKVCGRGAQLSATGHTSSATWAYPQSRHGAAGRDIPGRAALAGSGGE